MSMLDYEQTHFDWLKTNNWEGYSAWPYLDTHQPNPLITIGIGCATSLPEMLKLPFQIGSASGPMATQDQITAGFNQVMSMPGGMWYTHYQYPDCLWLGDDAIAALVEQRYDVFRPGLLRDFANFDQLPVGVRSGLLDLIWGYGPGGLAAHKPDMIQAVNNNQLTLAVTLTDQPGSGYLRRNASRREMMLADLPAAAGSNAG